jgi:glycyl-tRNA synthetase
MPEANVMEQIVSLCKRRGFIYPASEIYGGINGFWDYGPLGTLLKNNIRDWWWRNMVITPPIGPDGHPTEIVGIDTAIIQHPKTWVASGHVGGFSDPMVDDRETKQRFRADHLYGVRFLEASENPGPTVDDEDIALDFILDPERQGTMIASSVGEAIEAFFESFKPAKRLTLIDHQSLSDWHLVVAQQRNGKGPYSKWAIWNVGMERLQHPADVPSPFTGKPGALTEPRQFNLMMGTDIGAVDPIRAYLRPETAQGIFLNYRNVLDTMRVKVPFGVAQVGKSFRNEVTPRNYIFRSREFEQMEIEWFCHPDEAQMWYEFWKAERMKWWRSLGVSESNLQLRDHEPDELSHYSKMTVDIEYKYPFTAPDFGELEGIAHRGCYDLDQHQKHSGAKLEYFDQERNQRYIPNVIEPASGLTRAVLVLLCEAFTPDEKRPSKVFMKFHPRFAPIKAGIFPLVNKDGLPEVAEKLYLDLRNHFTCEYDAKQSIGKRYARNDEIGTPYCVTIDHQTLEDQTVTIRDRDEMGQVRIALDHVRQYLGERVG